MTGGALRGRRASQRTPRSRLVRPALCRRGGQIAGGERGAAVVDFALVSVLLCALVMGILQVGLALHVRNTLTWAASEGARVGARLGASPQQGAERSRELIAQSLSATYAGDVRAIRRVESGVAVVAIEVSAPMPIVALWGPTGVLTARGRAFAEDQP